MAADDTHIAEAMNALAFALYNVGADSTVAEAEGLYNQLLGFPDRIPQRIRASALEGLGDVRLGRQNPVAADSLYRRAIDLRTATLGADHPDNARGRWGLAAAVASQGDVAGAERLYRESLAMLRAAYSDEHRDVAFAHYNLGYFLDTLGRHAEAEEELQQAAEISARVNAPNHEYTGTAWEALGLAQLAQDEVMDAARSFERSVEVYRRLASTPTRERAGRRAVASANAHLGQALVRARSWERARAAYRDAWQFAVSDPQRADIALQTAELFRLLNRDDSVRTWRSRAVSLQPEG
jgi:tetratricopeptide (TPR) repeat protein